MRQKVGDIKHGIRIVFADFNVDFRAVRFHYDAVQRKRNREPLILFDAAVIMRFQKGKFALFVKWDLFQVKTGAVDVRDENSHALFDFFRAARFHDEQRFAAVIEIKFVVRIDFVAEFIFLIARFFQHYDGIFDGFPFGLAVVEKKFVALGIIENRL